MILSHRTRKYFQMLESKVTQGITKSINNRPYLVEDDPVLRNYEMIRLVWHDGVSIKGVCQTFSISRTQFYEKENLFIKYGMAGFFPKVSRITSSPEMERLILHINNSRPSLSQQSMLRMAEALPITQNEANLECISNILASHGRSVSCQITDKHFWGRIQRTLSEIDRLTSKTKNGRNKKHRKKAFYRDDDQPHKRIELLRELCYNPSLKVRQACLQFGIAPVSYYRMVKEYRIIGPWAIIPANLPGKDTMSSETELNIILKKLLYPTWSAQTIVNALQLRCSRFSVNRVFRRWGITDKKRTPIALDQYCQKESEDTTFKPITSAYHLCSAKSLLESRRINRHFELICKKMQTHAYHLCDPGPLILAPFVNDLGIVQAMESYGPLRMRGKELSNIALFNIFRVLSGYRRVCHLSNHGDRSVAFASGLGMFGSRSRYYEDTTKFKFEQLNSLRHDLIMRAKELKIVEGRKIAFDFHFKEFFGKHSKEKGIGKGPSKSGDSVPGFRPHVTWDLATNTILSMTYFHGGKRAPGILEQYCEQHIFPVFKPEAIREIYMDSEYTKEASLHYFKHVRCPNGDVYLCLKKNLQIKKLIEPVLSNEDGWEKIDEGDEVNEINVVLPKTGLPFKIVILRDVATGKNIRCFGSTNIDLSSRDLLQKYRYRWLIENGLKDLVYSYFLDEMYGADPEKIEFEFYCVMVARLTYEYFLKELGGAYYRHEDGNKTTLHTMRNLVFEKRNCTLEQDSEGHLILTFLDSNGNELEKQIASLLDKRLKMGKNRVLWWGNRGIKLRFDDQYNPAAKVPV